MIKSKLEKKISEKDLFSGYFPGQKNPYAFEILPPNVVKKCVNHV